MNATFAWFLSIPIQHSYFKDRRCPWVSIEPDLPTQKLFRTMNILSKYYEGEIKLLIRTPEDKPDHETVKPSSDKQSAGRHFLFLLKLKDNALFDLPTLDFTGFPKRVLYFSNALNNSTLSVATCAVYDGQLVVQYEKEKVPDFVIILNQDDNEIYRSAIPKSATSFAFDLTRYPEGMYKLITEFGASKKKQTQLLYYNSIARKEPLLGVVDIFVSDNMSTVEEDKKLFVIQLERPDITTKKAELAT